MMRAAGWEEDTLDDEETDGAKTATIGHQLNANKMGDLEMTGTTKEVDNVSIQASMQINPIIQIAPDTSPNDLGGPNPAAEQVVTIKVSVGEEGLEEKKGATDSPVRDRVHTHSRNVSRRSSASGRLSGISGEDQKEEESTVVASRRHSSTEIMNDMI